MSGSLEEEIEERTYHENTKGREHERRGVL
jgi:hypothetical protein